MGSVAGMAPVSLSFLGQVGRAFPEDGAVRGGYLDVAETSPGGLKASNRDRSRLAEIVRAIEEQVVIELHADAWSAQEDLQLVPFVRLDRAGLRPNICKSAQPHPRKIVLAAEAPRYQPITFLLALAKMGSETVSACVLARLEGQVVVGPAPVAELDISESWAFLDELVALDGP